MSDLPTHVEIHEEGPREGFQIEPGPIRTADKLKLIAALAETGLHHIQVASFVSPRIVPGWADAEDVVAGFTPKEVSATPHYGSTRAGSAGLSCSATS
jgi:isopropylmalate/homocitrate/citramalate synthase